MGHGKPLTPETERFLEEQADELLDFNCASLRMRRPECLLWPLWKRVFPRLRAEHSRRRLGRRVFSLFFVRFLLYLEYLEQLPEKPGWVFLTDCRDVVFQDDVFSRVEAPGLYCAIEVPGHRIMDCPMNTRMICDSFGQSALQELDHCEVSCAGTVLGDYASVHGYLSKMVEYTMTLQKMPMSSGNDQGVHNYLIHKRLVQNVRFINNQTGPIGTFGAVPVSAIRQSPAGLILQPDGRPYAVLHQHDRHPSVVKTHPAYRS
jgi:hypothetical protein